MHAQRPEAWDGIIATAIPRQRGLFDVTAWSHINDIAISHSNIDDVWTTHVGNDNALFGSTWGRSIPSKENDDVTIGSKAINDKMIGAISFKVVLDEIVVVSLSLDWRVWRKPVMINIFVIVSNDSASPCNQSYHDIYNEQHRNNMHIFRTEIYWHGKIQLIGVKDYDITGLIFFVYSPHLPKYHDTDISRIFLNLLK